MEKVVQLKKKKSKAPTISKPEDKPVYEISELHHYHKREATKFLANVEEQLENVSMKSLKRIIIGICEYRLTRDDFTIMDKIAKFGPEHDLFGYIDIITTSKYIMKFEELAKQKSEEVNKKLVEDVEWKQINETSDRKHNKEKKNEQK